MKTLKAALIVVAGLLAATATFDDAFAHGRYYGYPRSSFYFGFGYPAYPYWGRPYYYYPAPTYYYSPPVVIQREPQVYIERGSETPGPSAGDGPWWYYCRSGKGYYPYVKECPEGWERVAPEPPRQ